MADAYTDSYLQFRIILTEQDVSRLESHGELFCRAERSSRESVKRKKFPLWIYTCDDFRPRDNELRPWEEDNRQKYHFYISKEGLRLIKQRKIVEADSPRVWVRSVSISLEDVF